MVCSGRPSLGGPSASEAGVCSPSFQACSVSTPNSQTDEGLASHFEERSGSRLPESALPSEDLEVEQASMKSPRRCGPTGKLFQKEARFREQSPQALPQGESIWALLRNLPSSVAGPSSLVSVTSAPLS